MKLIRHLTKGLLISLLISSVAFAQAAPRLTAAQKAAVLAAISAPGATTESEEAWGSEVTGIANATLFPRTDSWWTGANIPGKPRYFSAYLGGSLYYHRIADVMAKDYVGFVFEKAHGVDKAEAS